MIPSLKKCSWKFKTVLSCLVSLLFFTTVLSQQKKCNYQNFWYKADYKNLIHAESEKNRFTALLEQKGLNDSIYAKAYNVTGIYYDFSGDSKKALVNFDKALKLLKKYPAKQIPVLVNIATENNIMGNFEKALQWSKKAMKLNDKYGTIINKAHIYHSMAASYLYKGDIEAATSDVLKGIKILEAENDKCYLGQLKITLAGTYLQTNNYRFAADLLEEYLSKNKDDKESKVYIVAVVNYTENLIELNQPHTAYKLLTDIIPHVQKSGDKELEAVIYAKLGYIEDLTGNIDKALYQYDKAYKLLSQKKSKYSMLIISNYLATLNQAKKYDEAIKVINEFRDSPAYRKSHTSERYEYERTIADIYTETKNWKESAKAFEKAMLMVDSLRTQENGQNLNAMQVKYQANFEKEKNSILENHNESLQRKVETERQLIFMYIIASLAIIVLILFVLRGTQLKSKLQKEELKSVATEKNYLEQQHALEQELSNSQKQMLEEKQREATSLALQMANYYDNLTSVLEKLDSNNFTKLAEVKKELQGLTRQKDYWKEFEIRFNSANPDFENKLLEKFPMLTRNDIQFCSLLKLNLSYKEIASLLQISYESAITKKYRIKKKIGIADDDEFEKQLHLL